MKKRSNLFDNILSAIITVLVIVVVSIFVIGILITQIDELREMSFPTPAPILATSRGALTGSTVASTYKNLLQVPNSNAGVDSTIRTVEDGEGTTSALALSSLGAQVTGSLTVTGQISGTVYSLAATDGYVLTANGSGSSAWEVIPNSHVSVTLGISNSSTLSMTGQELTLTLFDSTNPTTIQPDDAAGTGSAEIAAHRDHTHAIAAAAPASNLTVATTNAEGDATSFARSNHSHAITTSSNPGAAAAILATDASGLLTVEGLGISEAAAANQIVMPSGGEINTTAGDMTISPVGDLITDPEGNDMLPAANYDINIGSLAKKYLTLYAGELTVGTLVAEDILSTIGGRILVGPTTKLVTDLGDGGDDTIITTEHNNLAVDDTILLEAGGNMEYMLVTDGPTLSPPYQYTVTRNVDSSGLNTWYAGDAVFNTGTTGDGFIELYSDLSLMSDGGPTMVMWSRNSTTFDDLMESSVIGNLNGLYGYLADTYGVGIGKYGGNYITVDETNGLRMYGNDVQTVDIDTSGNLKLGSDVTVTSTTALTVDAAEGDLLVGSTGFGQANMFWDRSEGKLQFRGDTTMQVEVDTDGSLTAGGGDVVIDSNGIGIAVGSGSTNMIEWLESGSTMGGIYTVGGGSGQLTAKAYGGDGVIRLSLDSGTALEVTESSNYMDISKDIRINGGLYVGDETGNPDDNDIWVAGDGRIVGGLYVGSVATNPVTDNVYVDGDIFVNSGLRIGDVSTAPEDNTIEIEERSSDPGNPAEGNGIIWPSDGTGQGEDGDLVFTRTYSGTTTNSLLNRPWLDGPYTSTSWDGDAKNGADGIIDLSADFSLPAGIKAISCRLSAADETVGVTFRLSKDSGATGNGIAQATQIANQAIFVSGIVPCDANGDIYFSQSGELDAVTIIVTGYWF